MRRIVTGNQAVALGALRSGVRVVTGYPGTPSTGVVEHLLTMELPGRHVEWSTNEKVAFEIAAGAAWAGQRALTTMKMSGVNVAYDALISIAYSGTNGGLVILVVDDPGVSAGMAEQDSRGFALLSDLPMLEPSSVAEAYEFVVAAFEVSERARTPVFLRLTTAVALTSACIEVSDEVAPPTLAPGEPPGGETRAGESGGAALGRGVILERDIARYTKAGSKICLDQHRDLIERLNVAGGVIRAMGLNDLRLAGKPGGVGAVAVGSTYAYLTEALAVTGLKPEQVSILKAVATTPFPREEAETLLRHCGTVLVLEELEPFFERELWIAARRIQSDARIVGKLDGTLSRLGEYGVDEVVEGLSVALQDTPVRREGPKAVLASANREPKERGAVCEAAPRPITVCAGAGRGGEHDLKGEPSSTVLPLADLTGREDASRGASPTPAPRPITVCAGVGRPPEDDLKGERTASVLPSALRDTQGRRGDVEPAPRPITVCAGCPHRGTYMAIEAAIKKAGLSKDAVMVTGDIGCTILGMNPPFELIWNEVSMGSSVSLAQGYVHAGIKTPVIATIGDSTFFHAGMPGLLNAVQRRVPLTLVVMDNGWTAMTGMQVNPGTDDAFQAGGRRIDLARILPALGADRFDIVDPYDLPAMTTVLADGLREPGVKVVLARRECAIQARRHGAAAAVAFDAAKCVLCKRCIKVTGCPALGCSASDGAEQLGQNRVPGPSGSAGRERITVDAALCNGCGLCATACPTHALGCPPNVSCEQLGSKPARVGFNKGRGGQP
ncbi:MAG: thiamine pyrophosphate-dependent enzyme [Thermotogota bacterium]